MKELTQYICIILLLSAGLFINSCSEGGNSNNASTSEPHGKNAAFTSSYICPMHCKDSGSDAEGTCPVCGMAYVKLEEHTTDGHKH